MSDEPQLEDLKSLLESLSLSLRDGKEESLDDGLERLESGLRLVLSREELGQEGEESREELAELSEGGKARWASEARVTLRGLLQERGLSEAQRRRCVGVSGEALGAWGWGWVAGDPAFLGLLAQLAAVELRLSLSGEPGAELGEALAPLVALLETATLIAADDAVPVPDPVALVVSQAAVQAAANALQFLGKTGAGAAESVEDRALVPLLRYVAAFLTRLGPACLESQTELESGLAAALRLAQRVQAQEPELGLSAFLLPALTHLPISILKKLAPKSVPLFLDFLRLEWGKLRREKELGRDRELPSAISADVLSDRVEAVLVCFPEGSPLAERLRSEALEWAETELGRKWLASEPGLRLSLLGLQLRFAEPKQGVARSLAAFLASLSPEDWAGLSEERQDFGLCCALGAADVLRGARDAAKLRAGLDKALLRLYATEADAVAPQASFCHALSALSDALA